MRPLVTPAVLAAVPDFALGLACLLVWLAPMPLAPTVIASLTLAMTVEFLIIHSSAFISSVLVKPGEKKAKLRALVAIGVFYSLFAGVAAYASGSLVPLISFWMLLLNRMAGVLLGNAPDGEERAYIQRAWIAQFVCYLLAAVVTTKVPLPRLGLTAAVVAGQKLFGSGEWATHPHRLAAFGFLYFTAVGLSELRRHDWRRTVSDEAARKNRGGRQRAERLERERRAA